jgi:hypothetical protein
MPATIFTLCVLWRLFDRRMQCRLRMSQAAVAATAGAWRAAIEALRFATPATSDTNACWLPL